MIVVASEGSMFLAVTTVSQVWDRWVWEVMKVGSQLMQQNLRSHLDSLQQLRRDQSQLEPTDAGLLCVVLYCVL